MVDEGVVRSGEQVGFAFCPVDVMHFSPHFFEGVLYNVTGGILVLDVLQDKAIHSVRMQVNTLIIVVERQFYTNKTRYFAKSYRRSKKIMPFRRVIVLGLLKPVKNLFFNLFRIPFLGDIGPCHYFVHDGLLSFAGCQCLAISYFGTIGNH
jgi:hypothetical protein